MSSIYRRHSSSLVCLLNSSLDSNDDFYPSIDCYISVERTLRNIPLLLSWSWSYILLSTKGRVIQYGHRIYLPWMNVEWNTIRDNIDIAQTRNTCLLYALEVNICWFTKRIVDWTNRCSSSVYLDCLLQSKSNNSMDGLDISGSSKEIKSKVPTLVCVTNVCLR